MNEENKKFVKIILKVAKSLSKYYGKDDKLEDLENISLELFLKELKKEKIPLKIESYVPEKVRKTLRIKKNVLSPERTEYSWQDSSPKRKIVVVPFENPDDFSLGLGASTFSVAISENGVNNDANKAGLYEVIVFSQKLGIDLDLKKDFIENVNNVRKIHLGDTSIALLNNNLNQVFSDQLIGIDAETVLETGNGVQAVLRVALGECHFFRGYVSHDVAQWIAMFCVASGTKCLIRQTYLEEAMRKDLSWISDPNVERALSANKTVYPNLHKIWTESEWCRHDKAIAFSFPLTGWWSSVLKKTNRYENEIIAFNQQIFYLRRN